MINKIPFRSVLLALPFVRWGALFVLCILTQHFICLFVVSWWSLCVWFFFFKSKDVMHSYSKCRVYSPIHRNAKWEVLNTRIHFLTQFLRRLMNSHPVDPSASLLHIVLWGWGTHRQSSHLQQSGTYSLTHATLGGVPRRGRTGARCCSSTLLPDPPSHPPPLFWISCTVTEVPFLYARREEKEP